MSTEIAKVRIDQTVAILIDGNNIERSLHSLLKQENAMLNFDILIPKLLDNRGLSRLIYFREGRSISTKLAERLHSHYHGSVVPCHKSADIPLSIKATQIAPKVDTIIIMSGDSDYVELVRHLQGTGVRVEIAAVKDTTADILIQEADFFLSITREDCFIFNNKPKPNKPVHNTRSNNSPARGPQQNRQGQQPRDQQRDQRDQPRDQRDQPRQEGLQQRTQQRPPQNNNQNRQNWPEDRNSDQGANRNQQDQRSSTNHPGSKSHPQSPDKRNDNPPPQRKENQQEGPKTPETATAKTSNSRTPAKPAVRKSPVAKKDAPAKKEPVAKKEAAPKKEAPAKKEVAAKTPAKSKATEAKKPAAKAETKKPVAKTTAAKTPAKKPAAQKESGDAKPVARTPKKKTTAKGS